MDTIIDNKKIKNIDIRIGDFEAKTTYDSYKDFYYIDFVKWNESQIINGEVITTCYTIMTWAFTEEKPKREVFKERVSNIIDNGSDKDKQDFLSLWEIVGIIISQYEWYYKE